MASRAHQNGYFSFRNDHVAGGELLEFHSRTCAHCNRAVTIVPDSTRARIGLPLRTHPRGYCPKCDAYVCDLYACMNFCTPIFKLIELAKRRPDLPVLLRGPRGELLFDPAILDDRKVA